MRGHHRLGARRGGDGYDMISFDLIRVSLWALGFWGCNQPTNQPIRGKRGGGDMSGVLMIHVLFFVLVFSAVWFYSPPAYAVLSCLAMISKGSWNLRRGVFYGDMDHRERELRCVCVCFSNCYIWM